jgi:alpha-1,2-mannosyltransferase
MRPWMNIAFIVICIAFSAGPIATSFKEGDHNKDYDNWFLYGQMVVHGEGLYPENPNEYCSYIYPPTSAIFLFAPLSMLGKTAFVAILVIANAVIWYITFWWAIRLYTDPTRPKSLVVLLLPFLATTAFVYDTFLLGQINLALLLLMMAMFAALRANRPWLAGGALALATAIKAFPIAAIAYLLWRRQWQAAIATLVWLFVILVVLPAPFRGFERNNHELAQWYRAMLSDQSGKSVGQRELIGYSFKNQSMVAVVHRLTRHVIAADKRVGPNESPAFLYVNVCDISPREAQLVAFAAIGVLGMIYIGVMPRFSRQTPLTRRGEEAMLLLLAVICSPLSWTYFYCWALPAWIVITDVLINPEIDKRDRRLGWGMLGVAGLVMASALSQPFDRTTQALGATFWGGLGLYLILAWIMWRSRVWHVSNEH